MPTGSLRHAGINGRYWSNVPGASLYTFFFDATDRILVPSDNNHRWFGLTVQTFRGGNMKK